MTADGARDTLGSPAHQARDALRDALVMSNGSRMGPLATLDLLAAVTFSTDCPTCHGAHTSYYAPAGNGPLSCPDCTKGKVTRNALLDHAISLASPEELRDAMLRSERFVRHVERRPHGFAFRIPTEPRSTNDG